MKSYAVDGGRVAFDLGETSAELVSATPAAGWQMQVWKQTTWIRVTFTRDGRELSVFCVWHDTAPRVRSTTARSDAPGGRRISGRRTRAGPVTAWRSRR